MSFSYFDQYTVDVQTDEAGINVNKDGVRVHVGSDGSINIQEPQ